MLTPEQIKEMDELAGVSTPTPTSTVGSVGMSRAEEIRKKYGPKPAIGEDGTVIGGVLGKYMGKVGEANKRIVNKFTERGQNVIDEVNKAGNMVDEVAPDPGLKRAGASALGALKATGRATYEVAGGVGDIFLEAMKAVTPDSFEQKIKEKIGDIAESDKVKPVIVKAYELAQKYPEATKDIAGLLEVATLGGVRMVDEPITKIAGTVAEKAIETSTKVAKQIPNLTSPRALARGFRDSVVKFKYGENAEKALDALEKSYSEIPLAKNVMRGEAETGKSFARFMAEKPYIKMNVENSKFETWSAAQKLRQEAQQEAQAVTELLKDRVETVSLNKIRQAAKSNISKSVSGQEREAALRYIDNEFDAIERQMADRIIDGADGPAIRVAEANGLKQDFWDRSPFNPTASRQDRLASSIDYKLGHATKQAIEDAIPDVDLKALNSELGDYYHAIEVLESLHGGAAPKGRLGLDFARIAGTVAGSPGGIVGSIAGYMTADRIAKILMDVTVSQPFKRYAVQKLYEARPSVAKQVAEIVAKEQGERAARLFLPKDVSIQMGPETPTPSSVQLVPAPKGEPGRTPKGQPSGGQFFKTYKSGI